MANTKSALKQWRVSLRKHARSRPVRSSVRTYVAKAVSLLAGHEVEPARAAVAQAIRALDKAAEKNVLHPNNTARRKSRLMKRLNAASRVASAPEPAAKRSAPARSPRRRAAAATAAPRPRRPRPAA